MEANSNLESGVGEADSQDPAPMAALSSSEPGEPAEEAGAAPGAERETDADAENAAVARDADSVPGDENAGAEDPLTALANEAQKRRLSAADEERLNKLLQETLVAGREGVGKAIETLPKLPWIVGVNAVSAVWQEMKPTFRTRLLAGLARIDSEASRRMRLSLARGLYKLDQPAALKITSSVVKDMREKEGVPLSSKNAQIFASVFVGRTKPWVVQLPLAEFKPAEADLLVQTALLAVFSLPHPPAAQLGLLKWAGEAGSLARLAEPVTTLVARTFSRWSTKWRLAVKREVPNLPDALEAALKLQEGEVATAAGPESPSASRGAANDEDEPNEAAASGETDDLSEGDTGPGESPMSGAPAAQMPRLRPVYESKTVPRRDNRLPDYTPRETRPERQERPERPEPRAFNITETLRQIDQYVGGLKNELQQAQHRLRQREEEPRRTGRREAPERLSPASLSGAPLPEELARLNQQLELRNAELQARLEELREDAEIRAAGAAADPATTEAGSAPWRAVLALKLQDDFADFLALEEEAPDVVVKQHYPVLLRHVFEVLRAEGVALAAPPVEAPSAER